MLRAALLFFFIGLMAYILGAYNVAGVSLELGRVLLVVFLILSAISIVATLLSGKNPKLLS